MKDKSNNSNVKENTDKNNKEKSKKTDKIVTGVIIAVMLIAIGIFGFRIIAGSKGYRTVAVQELSGTVKVKNEFGNKDASRGQHLLTGDDVSVHEKSSMTLSLDSDKHVYADELTHFVLEAEGKSNSTKTVIKLDKGSTLIEIDNKLNPEESFEVETPNSTIAVRGTEFKVIVYEDESGKTYTKVIVYKGTVYTEAVMEDGSSTGKSRSLSAGRYAIIYSDVSDSDYLEEGNITEEDKEEGKEGKEGKEATISPDDLASPSDLESDSYTYDGGSDSYTYDGGSDSYSYDGGSDSYSYDGGSDSDVDSGSESGSGGDLSSGGTAGRAGDAPTLSYCETYGHSYDVLESVEATCFQSGYAYFRCSVCEASYDEEYPQLEHAYSVVDTVEPDCYDAGYIVSQCANCGERNVEDNGSALGHTTDVEGDTCSRCGAVIGD